MPTTLIIEIFEQVEPRDHGDLTITVNGTLLARLSNVSLYGDDYKVLEFVKVHLTPISSINAAALECVNIDATLASKIETLIRAL